MEPIPSCHVQSAYLLMSPHTPQGSVSKCPVTLVDVWGCEVKSCGVVANWPALSFLICLSVSASVVKSMASCCSGCVLLQFIPLWTCCCQIKPSTAPSDCHSLQCIVTITLTYSSCLSLTALLTTYKTNLGFNLWMSHAAISSCGQHSNHSKTRSVASDCGNINILWGGFQSYKLNNVMRMFIDKKLLIW